MLPSFTHGDFVLCFSWFNSQFKIGDVVIVRHPTLNTIIKRIADTRSNGDILLAGDNPQESSSSEAMGWQPQSHIAGKVIWHIAQ